MSAALPSSATSAAIAFLTRLAITCSIDVSKLEIHAPAQHKTDLHLATASSNRHDAADSVNNECNSSKLSSPVRQSRCLWKCFEVVEFGRRENAPEGEECRERGWLLRHDAIECLAKSCDTSIERNSKSQQPTFS